MEEDIKILKEFIRIYEEIDKKSNDFYFNKSEIPVEIIENILNKLEELEKENKELKQQLEEKDMEHELELIGKEEYTKDAMGEIIEHYYTANEDCVPKSKIEDKIKGLNEEFNERNSKEEDFNYNYGDVYAFAEDKLKELLED